VGESVPDEMVNPDKVASVDGGAVVVKVILEIGERFPTRSRTTMKAS
jgi:hypothetical protein